MEATEVEKLAALEDDHWWYRERRTLLRELAVTVLRTGTAGGRAVDVGSAAGGNTRVLQQLGMFAVPVELGHPGALIARGRGLPALRADARWLPFRDGTVDLAVAFDVLEHVADDRGVLSDIRRVLRPGGAVLVAVPADMALWSAHDDAVGHLRRYSRNELASAADSAGLAVERVWSWNVVLRPVVRARRKRLAGSDLTELSPVVNRALRAVVALERRVTPLRRLPGVSLLMVARRPEQELSRDPVGPGSR